MHKKLAEFIVTVGYIGKIKYAPGTFGSLAAFPLCYLIMHIVLNNQIILPISGFDVAEQQFLTLIIIELIATLLLFVLGIYFVSDYLQDLEKTDPREVVIDELVGQMLVIILVSISIMFMIGTPLYEKINAQVIDFICLFLLPFTLFRFFDVLKPWPIDWLDQNISGAIGVMIDDIAAAIFAVVSHYILVFFILDIYAK
jgi:phosphatidylglycerophosphatase A